MSNEQFFNAPIFHRGVEKLHFGDMPLQVVDNQSFKKATNLLFIIFFLCKIRQKRPTPYEK